MASYVRHDAPVILPLEPFEGFQGGPYGGIWYCTAFHPAVDGWPLGVRHDEAVRVGLRSVGGDLSVKYRCPWCGREWEE